MAVLHSNQLIGIIQGKFGDLVFAHTKDGSVIVRHCPERKSEYTGPELANQACFAKATAYVKSVIQQPELYAIYQRAAKLNGKRACDLAHSDFYHPPVITDIDLSGYKGQPGDVLRVQAVDNFEVAGLMVTLTDTSGRLVEQGAAVRDGASCRWSYVITASVSPGAAVILHVTAVDRPGHTVTKTVHHVLLCA